ncbi:unnamed protein product, partial [Scytosiphon promiscuus]
FPFAEPCIFSISALMSTAGPSDTAGSVGRNLDKELAERCRLKNSPPGERLPQVQEEARIPWRKDLIEGASYRMIPIPSSEVGGRIYNLWYFEKKEMRKK